MTLVEKVSEGFFDGIKRYARTGILALSGLGAVLTMSACSTEPERVERTEVEKSVDASVTDAVELFTQGKYAKAQGYLEERRKYISEENLKRQEALRRTTPGAILIPDDISPSEMTVLALSCAMNGNYDDGKTYFKLLLNQFKNGPTFTIKDLDKNLGKLFKDENYTKAENFAMNSVILNSEILAVVAFLKFGRHDYKGARQYFRQAIPYFEETEVQKYRDAFEKLFMDSCKDKKDATTVHEYAETLRVLYSISGKPEEATKK